MKPLPMTLFLVAIFTGAGTHLAAADLLSNGNLDRTQPVEIVPGFFLPKPADWVNEGFRTLSGPYEDEMSSEPWAGPAPTPVTTDGAGGDDWGVFFKPFSGGGANGPATGHLYQDLAAEAGLSYTLVGWAGAEANALGQYFFAIDFLDSGNTRIGGSEVDLADAGLFTANGEPFNYKQFAVSSVAPAGTTTVRARVTMAEAISNPLGGGQAFVVDDFQLTVIPEPGTVTLGLVGVLALLALRVNASRRVAGGKRG